MIEQKEHRYWLERDFVLDLLKQLPLYVFWKNTKGIYLGCNDVFARSVNLSSPEEIIGKTDYDLPWAKEESDFYRAKDKEVMQSRQALTNIEETQTTLDGKKIVLLTSKVPLLSRDGEVMGILGIYADITERKQSEIALAEAKLAAEKANEAKSSFIANMSHDIRTPLAGIIGMSKLLEEAAKTEEERQYAQWVHESGEQLLKLLNGVLDVVSVDNLNENDINDEIFDVRDSIKDIVQLETPMVLTKNLEFRVHIDESVPHLIITDRVKLHRILLNLVGNAIKFTEKGYISIVVQQVRDTSLPRLQFKIMDTGRGIPENLQAKVFERFYKIAPSYKDAHHGHGLGLHIVEKYLELLNGTINLLSEEGKGTCFTFTIPLREGKNKVVTAAERLSNNHSILPNAKAHILLIEDNPIALHIAQTIVKQAGCSHSSATNGEDAFELAKHQKFDLILTDIGLPGMSGYELTQAIRNWEIATNTPVTPIVGLTAHGLNLSQEKCIQAGMDKVLNKPITLNMLSNVLNQFISTSKIKNVAVSNDLPADDDLLFDLTQYPVLEVNLGINNLGSEDILRPILILMLNNELPEEYALLQQAYEQNNWDKIEQLAHKTKSSALYCGTTRLKFACQFMERYRKAGRNELLDKLYHQLLGVIEETKQAIKNWLDTGGSA